MMRPWLRCHFDEWRPHYVLLAYWATKEYLEKHPELTGTCIEVQLKDIRDKALEAYNLTGAVL
jgi:hypothetical protein